MQCAGQVFECRAFPAVAGKSQSPRVALYRPGLLSSERDVEIHQEKANRKWRNSETLRGRARRKLAFRGRYRFGEREARGSKQEEQFTRPEQNVQQASALEIAQVFRLQADVERLSRAFLDEGTRRDQVERLSAGLAAPRINALKPFITTQQEVVQAEILVIQCSNRGASTRTHAAVSFPKHRIHSTQAP